MEVVTALHSSAAALLIVAGLAKLARPAPTSALLAALGLPARTSLAAWLGALELTIGIAALAVGGPLLAGITGALYLGFAVAVGRGLAVGATSCGCFGRTDAPPSWVHVAGNVLFSAASFAAMAAPTPAEVMDDQPGGGLPFVLLVGVIAGLALVAFTALPEAMAARRPSTVHSFRIEREA